MQPSAVTSPRIMQSEKGDVGMTYVFKYQTYYGEINELPLKELRITGVYLDESKYERIFSAIFPDCDHELIEVEVIKEA